MARGRVRGRRARRSARMSYTLRNPDELRHREKVNAICWTAHGRGVCTAHMPNVNSAPPVAGLAGFNALGEAEAEAELLACCASPGLRPEVTARAPTAISTCWPGRRRSPCGAWSGPACARRWPPTPGSASPVRAGRRLGRRRAGPSRRRVPPGRRGETVGLPPADSGGEDPAATSREPGRSGRESSLVAREQSGVRRGRAGGPRGLAEGNRAYEERFGHVYLVCATGLSAAEMLARLERRLGNDEETERGVVTGGARARSPGCGWRSCWEGPREPVHARAGRRAWAGPPRASPYAWRTATAGCSPRGAPTPTAGSAGWTSRGRARTGWSSTPAATSPRARWTPSTPRSSIDFTVANPAEHHHVPLLLSPFAYSTYRGS